MRFCERELCLYFEFLVSIVRVVTVALLVFKRLGVWVILFLFIGVVLVYFVIVFFVSNL